MATILKDANITAISLVDKGANLKQFFLRKQATPEGHQEFSVTTIPNAGVSPLIKAGEPADGDDWSVVYCLVAVPGEVDQQGDIWPADEIEKAAHDFVAGGGLINFMHKTLEPVGELVQSAIALQDMRVNDEHIPKGSWYIALRPNPEMKGLIKSGQITGISVQGTSRREPTFTPGIDSPGTVLASMAKNGVRTLDGKAVKGGQMVALMSNPEQMFMVVGPNPETGMLVITNVAGETQEVNPLDLITEQTAQAKLEQLQSEQPAPMAVQYSEQPGQSPFQSVYDSFQPAEPQLVGKAEGDELPSSPTLEPRSVLDGETGVWRNIRGGRTFVVTKGEKAGVILAGPAEIRGIALDGLLARQELLPERFEEPIVKDSTGRRLHRGDAVHHVLDPSRVVSVAEVLPNSVVVDVTKNGGYITQSSLSPAQVAYTHRSPATSGAGGRGQVEELTAALIEDYDENSVLRDALGQLGIGDKSDIEPAIATGQITQDQVRKLVQLVDGPADAMDDQNTAGTVAYGQAMQSRVFKAADDTDVSGIDHIVDVLNGGAEPEVVAMGDAVEKAAPSHPRDKCVAGGCKNCADDAAAPVAKAYECPCTCEKCSDGVCDCTKGSECASCNEGAGKVEKAGEAFPGAAPPFGSKKDDESEDGDETPDGKKKRKKKDEEEPGDVDDKGDQVETEVAKAKDDGVVPMLGKKKPVVFENQPLYVDEPVKKADGSMRTPRIVAGTPRLAVAGEAAPVVEEVEKAPGGFPAGRLPTQPMGGRRRLPVKPGQPQPGQPGQQPPNPEGSAATPTPPGAEPPAQKPEPPAPSRLPAGGPPNRLPAGGPEDGAPKGDGQPVAPPKPQGLPGDKSHEIRSDLLELARRGDQELLEALKETGITDPGAIMTAPLDDKLLLQLAQHFLKAVKTSQAPAAPGHGLGISPGKAEGLIGSFEKALAKASGINLLEEDEPEPIEKSARLPVEKEAVADVPLGYGSRLADDGIVRNGDGVAPGKLFVAPDNTKWIAKKVTDTKVIGFAGGEEREFSRSSVHLSKRRSTVGRRSGERLPFLDGQPGGLEPGTPALTAGDFVVLPDGSAGEVVDIEGDEVTVEVEDKDGQLRRRPVPRQGLKVVPALEKVGDGSGSMGGHDPDKHGKIRHIVRGFGRWAGGKHSVCAARLRAEHPEVARGQENRLCAWLKDQYEGSTMWRGKHRDKVAKDAGYEPTTEEIDGLFDVFCNAFEHDPEDVLKAFREMDEDAYEVHLSKMVGELPGDAFDQNPVETLALAGERAMLSSDGSTEPRSADGPESLGGLRGIIKRASGILSPGDGAAEEIHLLEAVSALAEELASTAGEDDGALRKRRVDNIIGEFGRWCDTAADELSTR